ncbi:hypothetical protein Sm713_53900 [Streptomyces sp. TS71-3]|nr:hypothetical protein Sm713_53900 [Streptomyces sp. TS71-3]
MLDFPFLEAVRAFLDADRTVADADRPERPDRPWSPTGRGPRAAVVPERPWSPSGRTAQPSFSPTPGPTGIPAK